MEQYHHFHQWLDANTPKHHRKPDEYKIDVPEWLHQYNFNYINKKYWRPDYCWPDHMLIVEIEGGIFIRGGHSRGAGYRRDIIRYNTFTEIGYTVYRFIPEMLPLKSCYAIDLIEKFFKKIHKMERDIRRKK